MAAVAGISSAAPLASPSNGVASTANALAVASAVSPSASYLNLPSSYAGFGNDGSAFGHVGITNGSLAIVGPSASDAATTTATNAPAQKTAASSDPPTPYPFNPQTGIQAGNTYAQIAQVNERVAIATAQGQSGALTQLQPLQSQLSAQVNYQLFSGLGTSQQQPFARPEVPYVFLNVAR